MNAETSSVEVLVPNFCMIQFWIRRAEEDLFGQRGCGQDDQILRSDARGRSVRRKMKWRKKADGASERDQNRRASREAEQQVDEVAARSRQVDFHSLEPPEPEKYRETKGDRNAVGGQMQRALSTLGDELVADRKFQREPQQRDHEEIEPGGRRSVCARRYGDRHRRKRIGQNQGRQRNAEGAEMSRDCQKRSGQYGRNREQQSGRIRRLGFRDTAPLLRCPGRNSAGAAFRWARADCRPAGRSPS